MVTGAGKSGLPQDSTRLEAARRFPEMLHEDLRHQAKQQNKLHRGIVCPAKSSLRYGAELLTWQATKTKHFEAKHHPVQRTIEHCTLQFRSSCDLFPKGGKMTLAELEPTGLGGFTPPTRGAWCVYPPYQRGLVGGWGLVGSGRRAADSPTGVSTIP